MEGQQKTWSLFEMAFYLFSLKCQGQSKWTNQITFPSCLEHRHSTGMIIDWWPFAMTSPAVMSSRAPLVPRRRARNTWLLARLVAAVEGTAVFETAWKMLGMRSPQKPQGQCFCLLIGGDLSPGSSPWHWHNKETITATAVINQGAGGGMEADIREREGKHGK